MKKISIIISIILILALITQCNLSKNTVEIVHYKDSVKITDNSEALSININKGKSFNHPTFVIWKESLQGEYLGTLFITKSYATGIFGHAALSDSTWDNKPGESIQPAALPYWTHKKGLINNKVLVPTKDHPYIDAYTGATPKGDFKFDTGVKLKSRDYRILLEVNQPWDWNSYWTNNKFPKSNSYKHSAQPSLIYSVTIKSDENEFYLNPIGHGDPIGESGKLYTNLSTISSAKEIFESIKIVK